MLMSNVLPFKRKHQTVLEVHLLCYAEDFPAAYQMAAALKQEYRVEAKPIICDPESVSPGEVMMLRFFLDRVESTPITVFYDAQQ
jgi:hypothetical protein